MRMVSSLAMISTSCLSIGWYRSFTFIPRHAQWPRLAAWRWYQRVVCQSVDTDRSDWFLDTRNDRGRQLGDDINELSVNQLIQIVQIDSDFTMFSFCYFLISRIFFPKFNNIKKYNFDIKQSLVCSAYKVSLIVYRHHICRQACCWRNLWTYACARFTRFEVRVGIILMFGNKIHPRLGLTFKI